MANVKLSVSEKELVMNKEFILTKIAIIQKVYTLFGDIAGSYKTIAASGKEHLPAEIFESSAKISKGENYLQLPYVMMDYPRKFTAGNMFAIRSFFWWGNYFSISLIISGIYKDAYSKAVEKLAYSDDWFICVNESPWHHHFEADNFLPAHLLSPNAVQQPFIKTGKYLLLENWNAAGDFFTDNFSKIFKFLVS